MTLTMRVWWASALLVLLLGCGGQEPRYEADFDPVDRMGDTGDGNADPKKARAFIEEAVAALRDGDLEGARGFLAKAEPFADELKREEIRQVRQSVDGAEADKYIAPIREAAQSGKCEDALDTAGEVIDEKGGAIATFVRKGTSKALLKCFLGQLEIDLSIGRELAESERLEKALAKDDLQKYRAAVTDATVAELITRFEAPIAERRWVDATKLLDELMERQELGPREYNRIMGIIREGIAKDVIEKVTEALESQLGAADALKEVDELVTRGAWGEVKGSAVGGAEMPEEVATARRHLALWAECARLRCTLSKPEKGWAYGDIALMPALDQKGEALKTLEHATEVWTIATAFGSALVATKDPGALPEGKEDGALAARSKVAAGWIDTRGLKREDTAEMLPPGESIVGTRVWGPLREGQTTYELGKVVAVASGQDVEVARLADDRKVTLSRLKLRFGTLSKGTKVHALCVHPVKAEPARVVSVKQPPRGQAVVTIECLGPDGNVTQTKEELIGSLRAEPRELPARR